ncbi:ISL3 family transposase [Actinomadura sp. ATCC 31491]|uniref:ISL3 family transposase n=1 Tax=Actinomadura luzonensis TaxID=2805427 RepID=A0ABT0G0Q1_9ACTN|nr:ISL3 family transposase [Actinomadura luzonensis]MCK2218137.1 ISL3 family transposase [Actinomadura luzonensis]
MVAVPTAPHDYPSGEPRGPARPVRRGGHPHRSGSARSLSPAWGQATVRVELEVRRFICDNPACSVATFAEQVGGLTAHRQRRAAGLHGLLERVALALAGRAGARLAAVVGAAISRCSLIRLIRALPDPEIGQVGVLGVDDFAKRRGRSYATVLVDMDGHRIIDILPDRESVTFAGWLREHPGVQVICRDRAGGYATGAREGAPDAQQVADRWHMWDDLGEYVKKIVGAHHGCVTTHYAALKQNAAEQAPDPDQVAEQATADHAESRARVVRTRQRYVQVQALKAEGKHLAAIQRELNLAPGTVRRYFHASSVEEVASALTAGWPSKLDDYKPHLHQRWNSGCTNITQLHREIQQQGFRGGYSTVYAYLAPYKGKAAPPAVPAPPKVRHITSWIRRRPDNLDAGEQLKLKEVRAACSHAWLGAVRADDLPHLHTFANGIQRDYDAVLAGLSLPYSSGLLGHRSPQSTQFYAKITPTTLTKGYNDAGYFQRNVRTIEVLIDRAAVESGAAAAGEPWQYYDLGHGFCNYTFFRTVPAPHGLRQMRLLHPQDSSKALLLEAKDNLCSACSPTSHSPTTSAPRSTTARPPLTSFWNVSPTSPRRPARPHGRSVFRSRRRCFRSSLSTRSRRNQAAAGPRDQAA